MLRRADIVRAYSSAVLDSLETQRGAHVPLRELRGTQLVAVPVRPDTGLAGCRLADLALPTEALVIAVERDHRIVIPRGDTGLLPGDRLMILVQDSAVNQLHEHLATIEGGHESRLPGRDY